LLKDVFDGDYRRMLDWWRGERASLQARSGRTTN
jgi:hypothetical protein